MSAHLYRCSLWRENTREQGNRRRGARGEAFTAAGIRRARAVTPIRRVAGAASSSAACGGTFTSATLPLPSWRTRKCTLNFTQRREPYGGTSARIFTKNGGCKITSTRR